MDTPQPDSIGIAKFTDRERQVLLLLLDGLTTNEIAGKLGIKFKTAACHRAHILEKADVGRTARLLKWAIQNRIIEV